MNPIEIARCADCYTLMFSDEMNRCPAGHWTCPSCHCDCPVTVDIRTHPPAWLQGGSEVHNERL